jgi:hypothetical protein
LAQTLFRLGCQGSINAETRLLLRFV